MTAHADDVRWMQLALSQAREAAASGEVPVGAVVVRNGQLLATGRNAPIASHDPTAHAEVVAMRAAALALGNYRLDGCTLYVTLEPCAMCSGAMLHARLDRVVFGATDVKTGAAGSVLNLFDQTALNHRTVVEGGVLATECAQVLRDFFAPRRINPNPLREDALRTPAQRFSALPDWPWPIRQWTGIAVLEGLRMLGVDQQPASSPTGCVLCLHPDEGWAYSFRHLIPALLACGAHVVVPDLVGFGQSDKPKKEVFHSMAWHVRVLSAWMDQLALTDVVCALPRHGGMSQVGAALMASAPERFRGAVWLDGALSTSVTAHDRRLAPWQAAYDAPFPDRGFRAAQRAFVRWAASSGACSIPVNMDQTTAPISGLDSVPGAHALAQVVMQLHARQAPLPNTGMQTCS